MTVGYLAARLVVHAGHGRVQPVSFARDVVFCGPPWLIKDTREVVHFILVEVVIETESAIRVRSIVWTAIVEARVGVVPLGLAPMRKGGIICRSQLLPLLLGK